MLGEKKNVFSETIVRQILFTCRIAQMIRNFFYANLANHVFILSYSCIELFIFCIIFFFRSVNFNALSMFIKENEYIIIICCFCVAVVCTLFLNIMLCYTARKASIYTRTWYNVCAYRVHTFNSRFEGMHLISNGKTENTHSHVWGTISCQSI